MIDQLEREAAQAAAQERDASAAELPETSAEGEAAQVAPACPQCGGGMALRTARKGKNAGEKFWGCVNYPKCRGILKLL